MTKINRLTSKDKLFEQRLNRLADPPKSIYYMGQLSAIEKPAVAIVGSRKPTPYGQEMTHKLAYELARRGVIIISGLAIGIDGIAHQAALEAGGTTVAVLAGGLDHIYPYRHRRLANQIVAEGGALLCEYAPGTPALKYQFIARNRLIAALSEGVVITEAATKSGSLHTAQFALDLGHTVMAVPGLATNPMASGCLNLLRTGATLASSAEDVLFALGYQEEKVSQLPLIADSAEEEVILSLLRQGTRDGEELLARSQLSTTQFNQTLTLLEITGKVKALGGNQWTA